MLRAKILSVGRYAGGFIKLLALGAVTGVVCGAAGAALNLSISFVTGLRRQDPWIVWTLPLLGLVIVFIYRKAGMAEHKGTDGIFESVRNDERVPLRLAPLIFIGTTLTHLGGGSVGREGAALQMGGSLGSALGEALHIDRREKRTAMMCGMSAAFSAVFGMPVTATVFCVEVMSTGMLHTWAFFPCIIASFAAGMTAGLFGVKGEFFTASGTPSGVELTLMLRVLALGALCALVSILLCQVLHRTGGLIGRLIPNRYLRVLAVGLFVAAFTSLVPGMSDYNGAGMELVQRMIEAGEVIPYAFMAKLLLTAITLGGGFRGGEIVPTMFVGAAFGCFAGPLLGLDPGFAAALGLTAVFCGAINCPLASIFLSMEMFGGAGLPYYAAACAVSFVLSGYFSLYSAQRCVYKRLEPEAVDGIKV